MATSPTSSLAQITYLRDFPAAASVDGGFVLFDHPARDRSERATPAQIAQAGASEEPTAGGVPRAGVGGTLSPTWLGSGSATARHRLAGDVRWALAAEFMVEDYAGTDAQKIDAAVAAAVANGGGRVVFAARAYSYTGGGIVASPTIGQKGSVILSGQGPEQTMITFTGVANPNCILLQYSSAIGSGLNVGMGVEHLALVAPATKDVIRIKSCEMPSVRNVWIQGGKNLIIIDECRAQNIEACMLRGYAQRGVQVLGDTYSAGFFRGLSIVSEEVGVLAGFDYTSATTTDAGGVYLSHVVINGSGVNGFVFSSSVAKMMFVFLDGCASDGTFTTAAFNAVKTQDLNITNCHFTNHQSGGAALRLDAVKHVRFVGGQTYAAGAGAADVRFFNACDIVTVNGMGHLGPVLAYDVDATTHTNMDLRPSIWEGALFCDDATKLFAVANKEVRATARTFITDTVAGVRGAFGLRNSSTGIFRGLRVSATNALEVLSNAGSAVAAIADDGSVTVNQTTNDSVYPTLSFNKSRAGGTVSLFDTILDIVANATTNVSKNFGLLRWVATNVTATTESALLQVYLATAGALSRAFAVEGAGNALIGPTAASGASAAAVIAIGNGTAPTSSPVDTVQVFAADSTAGSSELFARNEVGKIERLTNLKARVSAQFNKTDTTLANVTGLSLPVAAGRTYGFVATLFYDASMGGGHKYSMSGTCTATAIIWQNTSLSNAANSIVINMRHTALGNPGGQTGSLGGITRLEGTITVNAAGTLTVQFAQNAASGTSSVLVGSTLELIPIGD